MNDSITTVSKSKNTMTLCFTNALCVNFVSILEIEQPITEKVAILHPIICGFS